MSKNCLLNAARHLLRERAQLGAEIRADDCTAAAAGWSSAERTMASPREGRPDRRKEDVSRARRRSRRRDPRRLGSAPAKPARGRQAHAQADAKAGVRAEKGGHG